MVSTVLGAQNHNVGASFVSNNLSWWNSCADIAVLTPVRPPSSTFVRDLFARVAEKPIGKAAVGPHRIPWEESQEEECDKFIEGLELPDDPEAEVCCDGLSFGDAGGLRQGLRDWIERQTRVAGRRTVTVEEIPSRGPPHPPTVESISPGEKPRGSGDDDPSGEESRIPLGHRSLALPGRGYHRASATPAVQRDYPRKVSCSCCGPESRPIGPTTVRIGELSR